MTAVRRLRSVLAPAAKTALLKTGGYAALRRLTPDRGVGILRYHAICGAEGHAYASPGICVTPEAFETHVAYLASHYAVLPLAEVVARLRDGRPLPPNGVSITFDDGYADNLPAARVLHRHGVEATFFVTAGCLSGGEPFWPAELRGLVEAIRMPSIQIDDGVGVIELPLTTTGDRQRAIRHLTRAIKRRSIAEREVLRAELRRLAGHPRLPDCMLTWEELREMRRLGMTIGAHTMTHANLPSAGLADATREIVESRARLEHELGEPVRLMSYPNGGAERYYTRELQEVVRNAGFLASATSVNACVGPASDVYALERIEVSERLEDLIFALEVEGRIGQSWRRS